MEPPGADGYEKLLAAYAHLANCRQAAALLRFDRDAWMPSGGEPARKKQLSALETAINDQLTGDELGKLLARIDEAALDDKQAAVVREIRRQRNRAVTVPDEVASGLETARLEANTAYETASEANDFDEWAPYLTTVREKQCKRARHLAPDQAPSVTLFADVTPFISRGTIDDLFTQIRNELVPFYHQLDPGAVDWLSDVPAPFDPTTPAETDETVSEEVFVDGVMTNLLDELGFDWDRGRFGAWGSPQNLGNQFDTRIKIQDSDIPLSLLLHAITGTIHELGHAFYDQGLPQEHYGTPLGEPRRGLHEALARFWESSIGKSRAFWEFAMPILDDYLGEYDAVAALTPTTAWQAINAIRVNNHRRVRADDLTYQLHLLIRYEIERDVIAGDLPIEEIPTRWANASETYLGNRPSSDREGPLQDPHWSYGFGCFHEYMIGSVTAAQLAASMQESIALNDCIRKGRFDPVHDWLGEHIYQHGKRYPTDELIELATGEPLTATAFLDTVRENYSILYDH